MTSTPNLEAKELPSEAPVVVVADDNADTLNIIRVKLEANGVRVVPVRNGQEAWAAVRKHKPALVILDVMMPQLNGFQVARMIKFDKQYKTTPVMLLTARTERVDREAGAQVGADDYVTKPFDPQELLGKVMDRVNHWLKQQQQARESAGGSV